MCDRLICELRIVHGKEGEQETRRAKVINGAKKTWNRNNTYIEFTSEVLEILLK